MGKNEEKKKKDDKRQPSAEELEDELETGLEDSFPASDPPAASGTTTAGVSDKPGTKHPKGES